MSATVEREITINSAPDAVWKVLAHEFDKVADWTSVVASSAPNTAAEAPEGATTGGRVCEAPGFGAVKETFVTYDEANKQFSYRADGLPGFVKDVTNSWSVTPDDTGNSHVTMRINLETGGIGKVLTPIMKNQMGKAGTTMLAELKLYIEEGKLSDAKKKANAKLAKKS